MCHLGRYQPQFDRAAGHTRAGLEGANRAVNDRWGTDRSTIAVGPFVSESVAQLATTQRLQVGSPAERVLQLRSHAFHINKANKALGSTYASDLHFAYTFLDGEARRCHRVGDHERSARDAGCGDPEGDLNVAVCVNRPA
jgi:hypothetical protein